MRQQTTIKQKLFLFLFAFFLTCFLLEIGLRVGGFIFNVRQEQVSSIASGEGQFRILCIGESTTALGFEDSYPSQLEDILNKSQDRVTFDVINKGRVGKNTNYILKELDSLLKEYQPDLVITMIGINDRLQEFNIKVNPVTMAVEEFLSHFRIVKLVQLIQSHWRAKFSEKNEELDQELMNTEWGGQEGVPQDFNIKTDELEIIHQKIKTYQARSHQLEALLSQNGEQADWKREYMMLKGAEALYTFRLGRYYRLRKQYDLADQYYQMAIQLAPTPDIKTFGYLELGKVYQELKDFEKATGLFVVVMNISPGYPLAYLELGRTYDMMGDYEKTYKLYKHVLSLQPKDVWIYYQIGHWLKAHAWYQDAEQAYLLASKMNPKDYNVYEALSEVTRMQGKAEQSEDYSWKAQQVKGDTQYYRQYTVKNYNTIASKIREKGIKHIAMQYPLNSVDHLKDIFWEKDQIIFVENKENFESALREANFADYFSDNFAGNFGHCTRAGNYLIAQRLADVILKEIVLTGGR